MKIDFTPEEIDDVLDALHGWQGEQSGIGEESLAFWHRLERLIERFTRLKEGAAVP